MANYIDLTGQTFGELYVISYSHDDKFGNSYWKCLCSCGKFILTKGDALRRGITKSCGHLRINHYPKDLTGLKFNRLFVLEKSDHKNKDNISYWLCLCDCGNKTMVRRNHLTSNNVRSCSCLQKEMRLGKNNYNYDPTLTDEERNSTRQLGNWGEQVKRRDNYECQICGNNEKLQAHHIFNYKDYPLLRKELSNGITMCQKHHNKFHIKYGRRNNTLIQLQEFIKMNKKYERAA